MKFYCTHFNFCRDHMGLTKEKEKWTDGKEYTSKRSWNH